MFANALAWVGLSASVLHFVFLLVAVARMPEMNEVYQGLYIQQLTRRTSWYLIVGVVSGLWLLFGD